MAKKSFKGGLGSLIEDSGIQTDRNLEKQRELEAQKKKKTETEKQEVQTSNEEIKKLVAWYKIQMEQYEKELAMWRTGNLTIDKFNKSLKKNGLKYSPKTNTFEEI